MRIEFDPAKDLANQAKHGVFLILASELDWESALIWVEQPSVPRRRALVMPSLKQDKAITAAAKVDPDAQPLTPAQLKATVPIRAVLGRPKSANKKLLVSVRYSPEVVNFFRSTGAGWQSRMDGALRQYVARHRKGA